MLLGGGNDDGPSLSDEEDELLRIADNVGGGGDGSFDWM
jgi:hypothetical protein